MPLRPDCSVVTKVCFPKSLMNHIKRVYSKSDEGAFGKSSHLDLFFVFLKLLTSAFDNFSGCHFSMCGEAVKFRNRLHGQCACVRAILCCVHFHSRELISIRTALSQTFTPNPQPLAALQLSYCLQDRVRQSHAENISLTPHC